ncbi:MAG: hypothetical protein FWD91_00215 [Treponema sp.]|nr:hypothetical protein [Treponema sp.]
MSYNAIAKLNITDGAFLPGTEKGLEADYLRAAANNIASCGTGDLFGREIAVTNHCYACTGSSCGGGVV